MYWYVGVLLGQDNGKTINVANSFAIPFEGDEKDSKTSFFDGVKAEICYIFY